MTVIFAIDPGPEESGVVVWDGKTILYKGILFNDTVFENLKLKPELVPDICLIENIASYGMSVGAEVFTTCIWIGRFIERAIINYPDIELHLVFRQAIKLHHCKSAKAKDSNIRQALIDKYGKPGSKKEPGVTFGLSSHMWAAFALATYWYESPVEPSVNNPEALTPAAIS